MRGSYTRKHPGGGAPRTPPPLYGEEDRGSDAALRRVRGRVRARLPERRVGGPRAILYRGCDLRGPRRPAFRREVRGSGGGARAPRELGQRLRPPLPRPQAPAPRGPADPAGARLDALAGDLLRTRCPGARARRRGGRALRRRPHPAPRGPLPARSLADPADVAPLLRRPAASG